MEHRQYQQLLVSIAESNEQLGENAAAEFANNVQELLVERDSITVMLATGNAQRSFLTALASHDGIEWQRIDVVHMDEYIGIADTNTASFRRWMNDNVVNRFRPKSFDGIRGDAPSISDEIARYTDILRRSEPSLCVMGIGENGHLAFNDPPADFDSTDAVKVVTLDADCRLQQVNEGHFAAVADVPPQALTVTVTELMRAQRILVLAPERRKAVAVQRALEGPITEECPASILQTAANAHLWLDRDSASKLAMVR